MKCLKDSQSVLRSMSVTVKCLRKIMEVKNIELNMDCPSCKAAKRAIDIAHHTTATALKKIREQHTRILELEGIIDNLLDQYDDDEEFMV